MGSHGFQEIHQQRQSVGTDRMGQWAPLFALGRYEQFSRPRIVRRLLPRRQRSPARCVFNAGSKSHTILEKSSVAGSIQPTSLLVEAEIAGGAGTGLRVLESSIWKLNQQEDVNAAKWGNEDIATLI